MASEALPILTRLFHNECRSLAQYLGESVPWTGDGDGAQALVRSIMADERRWAERIAELIEQRGGVARAGSYPDEFTSTHYLALDYMLRRLADYLEQASASLRRDRAELRDDPAARSLVEEMIERKQGQVEALRKLATARTRPEPVGSS